MSLNGPGSRNDQHYNLTTFPVHEIQTLIKKRTTGVQKNSQTFLNLKNQSKSVKGPQNRGGALIDKPEGISCLGLTRYEEVSGRRKFGVVEGGGIMQDGGTGV